MHYELAEVNIARLADDLDSPRLSDFVAQLEPINALADAADGFVWRLQTEDGDATSIVAFADEQREGVGVITNLSTWRDMESMTAYVYRSAHAEVMRRRREWFLPIAEGYLVCWWVPAGHRPSTADAEERLAHLRRHGPTPYAFTIKQHYPAPGAVAADRELGPSRDWQPCRA
ncbi:DUF3291 domain-containing protein [Nocardioides sp. GXZ039]|uniref:DUF3291 domain-containing protein n=1 Tax=Nocardioides sp. GXZ039 TaxID=3136018 RepID=UPI0030F453E4